MLNANKISRNARQKAIAFAEKMYDDNLYQFMINEGIPKSVIDESKKSNISGAIKGARVIFKKSNINITAKNSKNFDFICNLMSGVSGVNIDQGKALSFINDCLMVGSSGEFFLDQPIDDKSKRFSQTVWKYVYNLLLEIVDEVEEFYLADAREKTLARASSFYQSAGGMRECASYEGKRPFDTAVQTS